MNYMCKTSNDRRMAINCEYEQKTNCRFNYNRSVDSLKKGCRMTSEYARITNIDPKDADAQYRLGLCYEYGEGVTQSYEEAVKWYRLAAEQNNADAQNRLGLCYEYGNGVQQSYRNAAKWYCKAENNGYVYPQ